MKIKQIRMLTGATVVCGEMSQGKEALSAFAGDLMSDVLTLDCCDVLLITGLCNLQTIRTAEMAEVSCILFVRGKKVTPEMIELANENQMVLMTTEYSMFRTAGVLYTNGLNPVY
jgi:predicted transcriptional regulator